MQRKLRQYGKTLCLTVTLMWVETWNSLAHKVGRWKCRRKKLTAI